jgi:transaldolase
VTKLQQLHRDQGQSPWIDNLTRPSITGGGLERLRDSGIRGVTSNPTIFQKAISGSDAYDEQFRSLVATQSVEDAYWDLVVDDIRGALSIMRPVYDNSDGVDGFVSLEVAPSLAEDTAGTVHRARHFHDTIDEPNLYVKIPATAEGVPAIHQMVAEGRKINVTLIFSLERYGDVIEAYISGLEAYGGDLKPVVGVGSFFVSRVDTEVDRRLDAIGSPEALALRGKAAVAQAKLAYQLFLDRFSGPRWDALAKRGARVQRPLWASTSTKNPAYPDLLYVDTLIGPETVNTMPDATVAAFEDHGDVRRTIDEGVAEARQVMTDLSGVGVEIEDVAATLEQEGVAAFVKSFDELIQALSDKANALHAT